MTMRRVLGGLGAALTVMALVRGINARRRLVATAAPELRHRALYLPFSVKGPATLAIGRRRPVPEAIMRQGISVRRRVVPDGRGGPKVAVQTFEPTTRQGPAGALLWLHGGGYILGTTRSSENWCARVADELGVLVVNVEYRLAPENPFPAGLDDGYQALAWLHENAAELGVDPARIAVGGDSAGGGLAAAVAQRAHDGGQPVCFQLLVYPMLDDRTVERTAPGYDTLLWSPVSNRYAWTAYLGHVPGATEDRPYAVPARRGDLSGLPPAWIGVGEVDLFHDEDVDYARRLRAAGVDCELLREPGMYHAADSLFDGAEPRMTAFRTAMIDSLRTALKTR